MEMTLDFIVHACDARKLADLLNEYSYEEVGECFKFDVTDENDADNLEHELRTIFDKNNIDGYFELN